MDKDNVNSMEKGAKTITKHIDIQKKGDVHMDTDADVDLKGTGVKTAASIGKQKQMWHQWKLEWR